MDRDFSRLSYLASGIKFAMLVAILGLATTCVYAKVTGSISGTVRDTQGAVITGANVQAQNTETGVVKSSQTDAAGFYNFPRWPSATMRSPSKRPAFPTSRRRGW